MGRWVKYSSEEKRGNKGDMGKKWNKVREGDGKGM